MIRGTLRSLRVRPFAGLLFLLVLTSCEKGKPDKKKTDPGNISSVTLTVPASGTSVQLYGKAELRIQFSTTSTTLPYDPDPARGGMNLTATFTGPGGTFTVPGFYDGTSWRIRFAPMGAGTYTYTVSYQDPDSHGTWSEGEFTCVAAAVKGFARIDGRYLRMTDGSIFFPVGHNNGWLDTVEQPTLTDMASRGENLLAFWQAQPWAVSGNRVPIENSTGGIGNYNQNACAYLEGLIGRAESAGVYLQPTIWSHGELRRLDHPWGEGWWYNNGYSDIVDPADPTVPAGAVDANGPCATPTDFFVRSTGGVETEQWRMQKNFLRYLFARYGYSRSVLHWVVIAEVDGTNGFVDDSDLVAAWLQAVRDFWSGMDFYRKNTAGRCTLAAFATDWEGVTSTFTAGFDADMGLRSTDTYTRGYHNQWMALVGGAETTALYTGSAQPCFHGEIGGEIPVTTQPQLAHEGLWSCISAGACMTPLQWCDPGGVATNWGLLTDARNVEIRDRLQCVSAFMGGIGYLGDPAITSGAVTVTPVAPNSGFGWSTHTATQGFAWIKTTSTTTSAFPCEIAGLDNGTYSVQWYDVRSGVAPVAYGAAGGAICAGGTLTFTYPTIGLTDLACTFQRTGAAAPPATTAARQSIPPPTEDGTPLVPEVQPPAVLPADSTGNGESPPESGEPVKPPAEF